MSHHGTKTLPQFTVFDSCETNHNAVEPSHGNEYIHNYQNIISHGNTLDRGPLQMMHTVGTDGSETEKRIKLFCSRVLRHGDVFCLREHDSVFFLDFVSKGDPGEHHSMNLSGYPRDRDFFRVVENNGKPSLERIGDDILTVHEENKTATYYLPDKDIALHFTRVPRDGDFFSSRRNDNVLILEILSMESSQEHHNMHPDRDLYRVHAENGGFLLMKIDNNNIPTEESYFLGRVTEEENSTFTYYLPENDMVSHFNRLPTHADIFTSHRKNNIMILDVCPAINYKEHCTPLRAYGNPWHRDLYRIQQTDDGFELVKITYSKISVGLADKIRRRLKIRKYIASSVGSDKDGNACAVCLEAYKDFDRVGGIECGHEGHVICIIPWLRQKGFCPICKKRVMVEILKLKD